MFQCILDKVFELHFLKTFKVRNYVQILGDTRSERKKVGLEGEEWKREGGWEARGLNLQQ